MEGEGTVPPRTGTRRALVTVCAAIGLALALLAPGRAQAGPPPLLLTFDDTLTVALAGTGGGFVTSDDGNLNCTRTGGVNSPSPCEFTYEYLIFSPAPQPTLNATAAAGASFTSWNVSPETAVVTGCGIQSSCQVKLSVDVTVTATVTASPGTFPLSVVKAGAGSGTVTSAPAGIDCGTDCVESYTAGTVVALTAAAAAGSTFAGWSGACAGTGACVVTMSQARAVTATFDTQTFPLAVTLQGPANSGGVSSTPAGVVCPTTCSSSFPSGTAVTLAAQAAPGNSFEGWSGAGCSGTGACSVTMSQAQSVTAAFARAQVDAAVRRTSFRKNGPRAARRVLRVTVAAGEDLRRIVLRLRRSGVTIQSRRVRNFEADTAVIRMNVRNGIRRGRAQLRVTFTNEDGTKKTQTRRVRVPRL